jgi:hypothetical protein
MCFQGGSSPLQLAFLPRLELTSRLSRSGIFFVLPYGLPAAVKSMSEFTRAALARFSRSAQQGHLTDLPLCRLLLGGRRWPHVFGRSLLVCDGEEKLPSRAPRPRVHWAGGQGRRGGKL